MKRRMPYDAKIFRLDVEHRYCFGEKDRSLHADHGGGHHSHQDYYAYHQQGTVKVQVGKGCPWADQISGSGSFIFTVGSDCRLLPGY